MSKLVAAFLYGSALRSSPRGKCGYWESNLRHESVRLAGGQWLGEDSYSYECPFAPPDVCPVCEGTGRLDPDDRYDGTEASWGPRQCIPCGGTGYVPGPHWPYRFPKPPPLRVKKT